MLPNMSNQIMQFSQKIDLITTTQTVVNYRPSITEVSSKIDAVVQIASEKSLISLDINSAKSYYTLHTIGVLKIGDIVVIKSVRHKLIKMKDFSEYGYLEYIAEEIK